MDKQQRCLPSVRLNKFKYKIGEKHIRWGPFIGSQYTDCVRHCDCPVCGVSPGYYCQSGDGRVYWPPHVKRVKELHRTYPYYDTKIKKQTSSRFFFQKRKKPKKMDAKTILDIIFKEIREQEEKDKKEEVWISTSTS